MPISRKKIGKLVRLLGSPVDGEVIAAVAAILRTLESDGADFHWLADQFENPQAKLSQEQMQEIFDAGREAERQRLSAENASAGFHSIGEPGPHEMAVYCQQHLDRLAPEHHDFIDNMAALTSRGYPLSERRAGYLKSMFYKAGGGRR